LTLPPAPSSKNQKLQQFDLQVREGGWKVLAGVDEAGRGPLAGPVVSAAVIVRDPSAPFLSRIDDSKKLSAKARESAFEEIRARCAFSIVAKDARRIDTVNIYEATLEAMREAVEALDGMTRADGPEAAVGRPGLVLIDGPIKLAVRFPVRGIVGGDAMSLTIACASILAKVTRDRMMMDFHEQYPQYGFDKHKGYGTALHLAALKAHGPCPIHRRSFAPVSSTFSPAPVDARLS
jgi:ribonuclease HII